MNLELNQEERGLLEGLVDSRIKELHPEIRRSTHSTFRDQLKVDMDIFKQLLHRLQAADGGRLENIKAKELSPAESPDG